jgi:hypothetical protein
MGSRSNSAWVTLLAVFAAPMALMILGGVSIWTGDQHRHALASLYFALPSYKEPVGCTWSMEGSVPTLNRFCDNAENDLNGGGRFAKFGLEPPGTKSPYRWVRVGNNAVLAFCGGANIQCSTRSYVKGEFFQPSQAELSQLHAAAVQRQSGPIALEPYRDGYPDMFEGRTSAE